MEHKIIPVVKIVSWMKAIEAVVTVLNASSECNIANHTKNVNKYT